MKNELTKKQKSSIRRLARVSDSFPRINIIAGDCPPKEVGCSFYHTNRSGDIIDYPNAYASVGWSSMVYHPSTRRIIVGEDWIKQNIV